MNEELNKLTWYTNDEYPLGHKYPDGTFLLHSGYDDLRIFEVEVEKRSYVGSDTIIVFTETILGSIDADTGDIIDHESNSVGWEFDAPARWMLWDSEGIEQLQQELKEAKAGSQRWYDDFNRLRNKPRNMDATAIKLQKDQLIVALRQRDALAELVKKLLKPSQIRINNLDAGIQLKQILKGGG